MNCSVDIGGTGGVVDGSSVGMGKGSAVVVCVAGSLVAGAGVGVSVLMMITGGGLHADISKIKRVMEIKFLLLMLFSPLRVYWK
jgi:hypothetical protein